MHPYEASYEQLLAPAKWLDTITKEDGFEDMLWYLACWTVAWVALFYLITCRLRSRMAAWPASTKTHENDVYWCARNLIGIIHAVFISLLTVPTFLVLYGAPDDIRFGATGHLAACVPPENRKLGLEVTIAVQAVALAGLAFTAFTLADVGISLIHGLASVDFIIHHVAFITAGLIIRSHCMLPFNAAVLLSMEASTPFLNYLLLVRHRGADFKASVQVNGIVFMLLFFIFRLLMNPYGTAVLWLHHDSAMPPTVPRWQADFLLLAVAAGTAVQFFWFPLIAKTFGAGLRDLLGFGGSRCNGDPAYEGVDSHQSSEPSGKKQSGSVAK